MSYINFGFPSFRLGSVVFLLAIFVGCSVLQRKSEGQSFVLPGSVSEVWDATLETLKTEEIPVHITDESKRYIQTKTFPLYKKEYRKWAKSHWFASSGLCLLEIGMAKQSESSTTIGIKALFRRKNGFYVLGYSHKDRSRGLFEKLLAGRINDQLVKKKVPKLSSTIIGCGFRYQESIAKYVINEVTPDGLAYEQNLRNGDIVMEINGESVHPGNLFKFIVISEPEVLRRFKVKRKGVDLELPIRIFYVDPNLPKLGMTVVRDSLTKRFKIEEVAVNSPAEKAGLLRGDLIAEENGITVDSWLQYYRAMAAEKQTRERHFVIERNGISIEKSVTV